MQRRALQAVIPICLVSILCLEGTGCTWTPRVKTEIYQGPQVTVSLVTVPDDTYQASHPVNLEPEILARILKGVHVQRRVGMLQKLIGGNSEPQRVFSDEQVEILTPHLRKAFSLVTPEEQVTVWIQNQGAGGLKATQGTMWVGGNELYLTLAYTPQAAQGEPKRARAALGSDPTGIYKRTTLFIPEEATRTRDSQSGFHGTSGPDRLVIDYRYLAKLPPQQEAKPQAPITKQADQGIEQNGPIGRMGSATKEGKIEKVPGPLKSERSGISKGPITQGSKETQNVMEELRALKKELAEQKVEIERLKERTGRH